MLLFPPPNLVDARLKAPTDCVSEKSSADEDRFPKFRLEFALEPVSSLLLSFESRRDEEFLSSPLLLLSTDPDRFLVAVVVVNTLPLAPIPLEVDGKLPLLVLLFNAVVAAFDEDNPDPPAPAPEDDDFELLLFVKREL